MTPDYACDSHRCRRDADSWVIVAGRTIRLCERHIADARATVSDGVEVLYDLPLDKPPPGLAEAAAHPDACIVPECAGCKKARGLCPRHYGIARRNVPGRSLVGLDDAECIRLAQIRPELPPPAPPRLRAPRKRPPSLRQQLATVTAERDAERAHRLRLEVALRNALALMPTANARIVAADLHAAAAKRGPDGNDQDRMDRRHREPPERLHRGPPR